MLLKEQEKINARAKHVADIINLVEQDQLLLLLKAIVVELGSRRAEEKICKQQTRLGDKE